MKVVQKWDISFSVRRACALHTPCCFAYTILETPKNFFGLHPCRAEHKPHLDWIMSDYRHLSFLAPCAGWLAWAQWESLAHPLLWLLWIEEGLGGKAWLRFSFLVWTVIKYCSHKSQRITQQRFAATQSPQNLLAILTSAHPLLPSSSSVTSTSSLLTTQ